MLLVKVEDITAQVEENKVDIESKLETSNTALDKAITDANLNTQEQIKDLKEEFLSLAQSNKEDIESKLSMLLRGIQDTTDKLEEQ